MLIFLHTETLTENIQNIVNNTLRTLLTKWNQAFSKLNGTIGKMDPNTCLAATEDTLQEYCKEILRSTMKMSSLCQCISSGGQNTATYENFEQVLSKGGLGNLFEQYWQKVVHILKKSLSTMKEKSEFKKVFDCISLRYPSFHYNLSIVWQMYLREIATPEETEQFKYKENLMSSIQIIKEEYIAGLSKKLKSDYEDLVQNLDGYSKVIEKLEKVEKIEKLQKSARQIIDGLAGYLVDMKGQQQQEILDIVFFFSLEYRKDK